MIDNIKNDSLDSITDKEHFGKVCINDSKTKNLQVVHSKTRTLTNEAIARKEYNLLPTKSNSNEVHRSPTENKYKKKYSTIIKIPKGINKQDMQTSQNIESHSGNNGTLHNLETYFERFQSFTRNMNAEEKYQAFHSKNVTKEIYDNETSDNTPRIISYTLPEQQMSNKATDKSAMIFGEKFEYKGTLFNGEMHGTGILRFDQNYTYSGKFQSNQFHGKGVLRHISNLIFDGIWIHGKVNGPGKLYFPNKHSVQGNWIGATIQGFGVHSYPSEVIYYGVLQNGIKEGPGQLIFPEDSVVFSTIKSRWVNDTMHGKAYIEMKYPEKYILELNFVNGVTKVRTQNCLYCTRSSRSSRAEYCYWSFRQAEGVICHEENINTLLSDEKNNKPMAKLMLLWQSILSKITNLKFKNTALPSVKKTSEDHSQSKSAAQNIGRTVVSTTIGSSNACINKSVSEMSLTSQEAQSGIKDSSDRPQFVKTSSFVNNSRDSPKNRHIKKKSNPINKSNLESFSFLKKDCLTNCEELQKKDEQTSTIFKSTASFLKENTLDAENILSPSASKSSELNSPLIDDKLASFKEVVYMNSAEYHGDIYKNQRHGYGILKLSNMFYEGCWKHDRPHGKGRYVDSLNKISYEGYWDNGLLDGNGVLVFQDGSVYKGQFKENLMHGFGTLKYASGDVFEGCWENDKGQGPGTYTIKDEAIYKIRCEMGSVTCKAAEVTSSKGSVYYCGGLKQGDFFGNGTLHFSNDIVLRGEWQGNKFCGALELYSFNDSKVLDKDVHAIIESKPNYERIIQLVSPQIYNQATTKYINDEPVSSQQRSQHKLLPHDIIFSNMSYHYCWKPQVVTLPVEYAFHSSFVCNELLRNALNPSMRIDAKTVEKLFNENLTTKKLENCEFNMKDVASAFYCCYNTQDTQNSRSSETEQTSNSKISHQDKQVKRKKNLITSKPTLSLESNESNMYNIETSLTEKKYTVLLPRFIEVPVPEDAFDSNTLCQCKELNKMFTELCKSAGDTIITKKTDSFLEYVAKVQNLNIPDNYERIQSLLALVKNYTMQEESQP